jgi:ribosome-associated toxin RatA of RatAB toxin-antitoxin module
VVFCSMALCNLVEEYQNFLPPCSGYRVVAEGLFKTFLNTYESTRYHDPQSDNLNTEGGFYREVKYFGNFWIFNS